jgi:tetratricopeptide (TPR) repeat protein
VGPDLRAWHKASKFNERGRACADAGDWDDALSFYRQAVGVAPAFEPAWFNMGLIYKWRREWAGALACCERAASLGEGGDGEPAWWNLGIAATALRRWDVARNAWRRFGIAVPDGDGEIQMRLGLAPVRLSPREHGEVVWGLRIDPARIVIKNVPLPESGHRLWSIAGCALSKCSPTRAPSGMTGNRWTSTPRDAADPVKSFRERFAALMTASGLSTRDVEKRTLAGRSRSTDGLAARLSRKTTGT